MDILQYAPLDVLLPEDAGLSLGSFLPSTTSKVPDQGVQFWLGWCGVHGNWGTLDFEGLAG
jgi:hypothetical protein